MRSSCVSPRSHTYGETKPPELYRITYDGSIADEPHFVVMGGTTEPIVTALKDSYAENADLHDALHIAVEALRAGSADTRRPAAALGVASLEVAILEANRPRRAFRRINRSTLETLREVGIQRLGIRRRLPDDEPQALPDPQVPCELGQWCC